MEPIHLSNNPYQGPDAQLLSYLQEESGLWRSFRNSFVVYIEGALNNLLPQDYAAKNVDSLQPMIHQLEGYDPNIRAAVIFKWTPDKSPYTFGDPVVRIELISPSGKRNSALLKTYMTARQNVLEDGIVLCEVDVLHTLPSPLDVPCYPRENDSHPYYIAITDPRQSKVETRIVYFDVDESFPLIDFPLIGEEIVRDFDLGVPYNETYRGGRWGTFFDYAEIPALDTYSPADQERIKRRMQVVIDGVKARTIQ